MLWVDRHRPKTLAELDAHPETDAMLQRLVDARDIPHLLFYGPPGAGKKTRVMALLRAHFGIAATHVRLDHRAIDPTDSKSIEIAAEPATVARILRGIAEKEKLVAPFDREGADRMQLHEAATPADAFFLAIARQSEGNMRRAILSLNVHPREIMRQPPFLGLLQNGK